MTEPPGHATLNSLTVSASPISNALWEAFLTGDRRACAKVITRVENDPSAVAPIREALAGRLGKAIRIGITGPPGVGKSTLSSALALGLAEAGHKVGVVAIDPSSPFTGGAFMGDRVRMDQLVGNDRVFVRSLASREGHGGLSPATPYVADVLEGFGCDRILIETVGVGQAEVDVLACTDMVLLVLQPSTGDAIQTMKAGIIEGADIVVVNKADLPGVEPVLQSLRFLFSVSGPRKDKPIPPILTTSALQTEGIEKLIQEVEQKATHLVESGVHLELKRKRMEKEIREAIRDELWKKYAELTNAEADVHQQADHLAQEGGSPYAYIRDAMQKIEIRGATEQHDRRET